MPVVRWWWWLLGGLVVAGLSVGIAMLVLHPPTIRHTTHAPTDNVCPVTRTTEEPKPKPTERAVEENSSSGNFAVDTTVSRAEAEPVSTQAAAVWKRWLASDPDDSTAATADVVSTTARWRVSQVPWERWAADVGAPLVAADGKWHGCALAANRSTWYLGVPGQNRVYVSSDAGALEASITHPEYPLLGLRLCVDASDQWLAIGYEHGCFVFGRRAPYHGHVLAAACPAGEPLAVGPEGVWVTGPQLNGVYLAPFDPAWREPNGFGAWYDARADDAPPVVLTPVAVAPDEYVTAVVPDPDAPDMCVWWGTQDGLVQCQRDSDGQWRLRDRWWPGVAVAALCPVPDVGWALGCSVLECVKLVHKTDPHRVVAELRIPGYVPDSVRTLFGDQVLWHAYSGGLWVSAPLDGPGSVWKFLPPAWTVSDGLVGTDLCSTVHRPAIGHTLVATNAQVYVNVPHWPDGHGRVYQITKFF